MSHQPIHLCYYSNRCKWSKAFIEEVSKTPHFRDFHFVCVDQKNPAELPKWLKQTPSLVIRGEKSERIDGQVMNWIYEQRIRTGNKSGSTGEEVSEPEPYLDQEMSGFQDSYAFLGIDTSAQGDGGRSLQHSFTFLGGQEAIGTKEATRIPSSSSGHRSKKEEMFESQMEEYMKSRDQGMPQRITRQ